MSDAGPPNSAWDAAQRPLDRQQLQSLARVPAGAVALSTLTVVLLLLGWLFVYFLYYLPRGLVS